MTADERTAQELYDAWRAAEGHANAVLEEVGDDMGHPRYQRAAGDSGRKLKAFLGRKKPCLRGVLLKLKAACYFEDYPTDANNPACTDVAPRVIIAAMEDLERLISVGD